VLTHSPVEAALLRAALPQAHVACVPWATPPVPVATAFADRPGIGFIGSYGHKPNLDAAIHLLGEIMPRVWRHAPVPLLLAGHGLPPWLAGQAEAAPGPARTLATLPDAAAFWRQIRVSAAPLRFGAGIKGKVLDSLAAGIPCVCSPVAAEGLALPAELIAGDDAAMAAALLHLHSSEAANAAAAAGGQAALSDADAVVRALRAVAG